MKNLLLFIVFVFSLQGINSMQTLEQEAEGRVHHLLNDYAEAVGNILENTEDYSEGELLIVEYFKKKRRLLLNYDISGDLFDKILTILRSKEKQYADNFKEKLQTKNKLYQESLMNISYNHFIQNFHKDEGSYQILDLNRLVTKHFVKGSPPFYKLTFKGRDIYILGSIHDIPLKALLSTGAYNEVERILKLPNHTLFLEDKGIDLHKQGIAIKLLQEPGEKQWEIPPEYEKCFSGKMLSYIPLQGFSQTDIPFKNIMNLDYNLVGRMCLSNQIKLKKLQFFGSSFEDTLEMWNQGSPIYFLDHPSEDTHQELLHHTEYLQVYNKLQESKVGLQDKIKKDLMNSLMELWEYEGHIMTECEYGREILNGYEKRISDYTHAHYRSHHGLKPNDDILLVARNQLWIYRFLHFLNTSQDENPVVIVCGAAHLSKALGPNNFLTLLIQHLEVSIHHLELQRYTCTGSGCGWLPYDNND